MQDNLFVMSHIQGKLFSLDTYTYVDGSIPKELQNGDGNDGEGSVVKKLSDGTFESVIISDEDKNIYSHDENLRTILNATINESCKDMIVYDVAWWAMGFNNFMRGFTNHHFEV